ncbi:MAG TPA: hypothetical protein VFO76_07805 [Candidatus Kapabacteria bacterium]|nr:hypothetical protein [Candidatus Kapabacteria bacterium]
MASLLGYFMLHKKAMKMFYLSVLLLVSAPLFAKVTDTVVAESKYKQAIDFSPLSPAFRIYAVQYTYEFSEKNEVMLGLAYVNVTNKDIGINHDPTIVVGYRRYLWKKLHLEYQLWPGYNHYFSIPENTYFDGFDLWNEFRLGYRMDFHISTLPVYLNYQVLAGFGLYGGNKPQSFKDWAKRQPFFFVAPVLFMGIRF